MGRRQSEPQPIHTISLNHPITIYGDGEQIEELHFYRRANLGDLRAAERQAKGEIAITTVLLMRLCNLTMKEIEAIDLVDMGPIGVFLEYLTGEGPDPRKSEEPDQPDPT
jgi:hypothetical protein